ncbi:MAG: FixH family protein [Woeseiaceae bacterium]
MKNALSLALIICLSLGGVGAQETSWTSEGNAYVVRYQSELQPLQINKLHAWIIHVEDIDGTPVEGAIIEATGGMPLHDHGLPTRPRMTAEIGAGDYRLDGMRFHMAGEWQITILIHVGESTDTVVITLTL